MHFQEKGRKTSKQIKPDEVNLKFVWKCHKAGLEKFNSMFRFLMSKSEETAARKIFLEEVQDALLVITRC